MKKPTDQLIFQGILLIGLLAWALVVDAKPYTTSEFVVQYGLGGPRVTIDVATVGPRTATVMWETPLSGVDVASYTIRYWREGGEVKEITFNNPNKTYHTFERLALGWWHFRIITTGTNGKSTSTKPKRKLIE